MKPRWKRDVGVFVGESSGNRVLQDNEMLKICKATPGFTYHGRRGE